MSLKRFDVFISFRGEDTRRNFTSHLYEALSKRVLTFIDDNELEKGDEISSALAKAIEESEASVVIFSKHYASSKWCLNELVKILECKRDGKQIVIPVFYEIEPSHVRNQTESYGQAFEEHERHLRHNRDKLQKWKDALTDAANLAGWNSQNYRMESNFIKDIVEDVLKKLNGRHPFEVNKELVGIEKKYEQVELLLEIGSNDVRTIALWGMGGIGKTTLAEYLYAKLCSQFEHHCFIENIREESIKYGLKFVRKKLFSTLLDLNAPYVETPIFIRRLAYGKSLIVLDDVATLEQAENLNIVDNCLGAGSRVIITTRDKEICSQFDECEIYEVEEMNQNESLELFCWSAFGEERPKEGYEYLSKMAIIYCRGNPLTLKVLGANLRAKKSKEAWLSEMEKLKKIPNKRIHDVLKLSFDDLDPTQQDIFLDIACIYKANLFGHNRSSKDRHCLTAVWNACNFFAESGLEVLLYKALIYFENSGIRIHGLLVEMGREIIKKESPKDPGRRSRLWNPQEVYDILRYNKGTDVVEVIDFDISQIGDVYLSSDSFKCMTNLRYLYITNNIDMLEEEEDKVYIVHLPEGLEWLSDKLRHLYWESFPLESFPSTICIERLVKLSMHHSKLKKLWDGIQRLDNLVVISLDDSKDLIEIPNLSKAPNLELVSLRDCVSLRQLHPSLFNAPNLKELDLLGCKMIESLNTKIQSKEFQSLNLVRCSSLVEFPSWIWDCRKLTSLNLNKCEKLNTVGKKLPNDSGLVSLTELHLEGCTQLNASNLWFILDGTPSLRSLYLRNCCNLETLPNNIQNNSMLKFLSLNECRKLKSLPKLPASLQTLAAENCIHLDLIQCKKRNIFGEKLLNDTGLRSLRVLRLNRCTKINAWNLWFILDGSPSLEELSMRGCCNLETLPDNIQNNSMLKTLDLGECSKLKSIPNLPPLLQNLTLDECRKLKSLPKLPTFLQTLDLCECSKLKSIPKLPPFLQKLKLDECMKLKSLLNLPPTMQRLTAINSTYFDTNSIQHPMLENMLHKLQVCTDSRDNSHYFSEFYFIPGAQVPSEFDFRTTKASIVIPPIPKYGLCGFSFCIILSKNLDTYEEYINYEIYEHTKKVERCCTSLGNQEVLLSDHVFMTYWYINSKLAKVGSENRGDHYYNLSFEFKIRDIEEEVWSTNEIKGCGVIPVYFWS